ncbi:MAG: putative radical SAM family enzyme, NOT coproporphyrinogen III oxidase, oxygen-independent [Firmicutes bacterium]|nr:putative radical SAM family enzyme, NOT coproporphyrinogen III oxidase, oxygen-independent [Bacillota bacterium]
MISTLLRRTIARKKDPFLFTSYNNDVDFTTIPEDTGLYIHIPFCRALCPFCPYNKTGYSAETAEIYMDAVIKELHMLKKYTGNQAFSSLYIGGGTPTLMLDRLRCILEYIFEDYNFSGDIGIEVHPSDAGGTLLKRIRKMGINMVSLGVQTFDDDVLGLLGRGYAGSDAAAAVKESLDLGFDCVDVDIMFNLPGQTVEDAVDDVRTCFALGVDQVSIYPMIVFPMTPLYKQVKDGNISRFNNIQEYRVLKEIKTLAGKMGYERTSIWTYGRKDAKRYSSVTRESFLGVGAGATSLFGGYFYLNTFDVDAYVKSLSMERLPINLVNRMSPRERMVFWLFWRCYDTSFDLMRFHELFGCSFEEEFPYMFRGLKALGLAVTDGGTVKLTDRGAYIYHLIEKHYSETYLNDMWEACRKNPWVESFSL